MDPEKEFINYAIDNFEEWQYTPVNTKYIWMLDGDFHAAALIEEITKLYIQYDEELGENLNGVTSDIEVDTLVRKSVLPYFKKINERDSLLTKTIRYWNYEINLGEKQLYSAIRILKKKGFIKTWINKDKSPATISILLDREAFAKSFIDFESTYTQEVYNRYYGKIEMS